MVREQKGGAMHIVMDAIGFVRGGRVEATKDGWGSNESRLELRADLFAENCLHGLETHSHVEVIF